MTKDEAFKLADVLRDAYLNGEINSILLDDIMGYLQDSSPKFNAFLWSEYLRGECGITGRNK